MNKALQHGSIRLRPLEPEDIDLLYQWENDMSLWTVSNTLTPYSRYILKEYIRASTSDIYEIKQLRLIIENTDGKPVGAIDLFDFDPYHQRAGLGILIYRDEDRGKGYASDSLSAMCLYAKETLGLHQLYANITQDNTASIHLFERAGFSLSGVKKDWTRRGASYVNECLYQKLL